MSRPFDLTEIIPRLLNFRNARDWEQFHIPKELTTALSIEVGELQEHFLWRNVESPEEISLDEERLSGIEDEVADIAIFLLYFCHDMRINLHQAIEKKLHMNEKKYPVEKFRGRFG